MADVLLIGHDRTSVEVVERILRAAGHVVVLVTAHENEPISEERLRSAVESAVARTRDEPCVIVAGDARGPQPHAAERWANAIVPIIECPGDPRTITGWSRCVAASPGAIRNWCVTAGISPRRSLVFGRLLRAVVLSEGGRRRPENLLDVVDRRTLCGLLRLGGFDHVHLFPTEAREFLERQTLVRDAEALRQIERALNERHKSLMTLYRSA